MRPLAARIRRALGGHGEAESRVSGRRSVGQPINAETALTPGIRGAATVTGGPAREGGVWSADGRLLVEAVAVNGRSVGLEVRLTYDLVWVGRVESPSAALFDRAVMRRWLAEALAGYPMADLVVDEACLSVGESGRVALSLGKGSFAQPPVSDWELSPAECAALLTAV